ncbi:MAG: minor capsid protein [Deltaproteobacteria bacterium]|nr:minor capsid protein [Deltaproteobacteria bacterium]
MGALQWVRRLLEQHRGPSIVEVAKRVREQTSASKSKAELTARDQVLKLNSAITQDQHLAAGITEYEWSTSGDERVRDGHKKLDGKRFKYAEPPVVDASGRRANPGEDYQCRCVAVPVLDDHDLHAVRQQPLDPSSEDMKSLPPKVIGAPRIGYLDPAAAAEELAAAPIEQKTNQPTQNAPNSARAMMSRLLHQDDVLPRDASRPLSAAVQVVESLDHHGHVAANYDPVTGLIRLSKRVSDNLARALNKLGSDDQASLTSDEVSAVRTLLHEILHGASPAHGSRLTAIGMVIEEATTDISARHYARKATGVDHAILDLPSGNTSPRARDSEIRVLRQALISVVRLPPDTINMMLTTASLRLKASTESASTDDELARLFSRCVRWPEILFSGLDALQRNKLEERYRDGLLAALRMTTMRTDGAAMKVVTIPEVYTIPRNNVPAALAFWCKHVRAGTLRPEDVSILYRLQDNWQELSAAMDAVAESDPAAFGVAGSASV